MSPQVVIAMYRPKEGKDAELRDLIDQHFPTLERLELVTERRPVLIRSENGTYIEIMEWRSAESSAIAHQHPELAKIWEAMGKIADFPGLDSLPESKKRFPHFQAVN